MWDSVYSVAPAINALSRQAPHRVVRDNAEMQNLQAEGGAGNSGPAPSPSRMRHVVSRRHSLWEMNMQLKSEFKAAKFGASTSSNYP